MRRKSSPKLVKMPTDFRVRKHEVYWNYSLTPGAHQVRIERVDTNPHCAIALGKSLAY